jgi:hypothetical protein
VRVSLSHGYNTCITRVSRGKVLTRTGISHCAGRLGNVLLSAAHHDLAANESCRACDTSRYRWWRGGHNQ